MNAVAAGPVRVVITGVAGGAVGHELLQALRLAATKYRIVAADASAHSLGLYDADSRHLLPLATDAGYMDALTQVCTEEGAHVLIPGSEAELKVVSQHRSRLLSLGVLPLINSEEVVEIGLNKALTYSFLMERGYEVPQSLVLTEAAQVEQVTWFPCVVKPVAGTSGSNLVFIAQDREELQFFAAYVRSAGYLPMAQAYVGTPEDEYTVGVLHGLDGHLAGSIALRRDIMRGLSARLRIRSRYSSANGAILALSSGISQGLIEDAPDVRVACEGIAAALGSRGPLNLQLRYVDGIVYLFEINPRFSGSCSLRAIAGFNEADILIRHHLFGEPFTHQSYRTGTVVRGLTGRLLG